MSEFSVKEVVPLQVAKARLREMRRRVNDMRPVFQDFGDYMAGQFLLQFETEGAHFGTPWEPLSPAYAAWKVSKVGPKPILQLSGDLMKSFTARPMSIERITRAEAEYGSDDFKAIFHQKGTSVMPARPIVRVTESMENELIRLATAYVTDV